MANHHEPPSFDAELSEYPDTAEGNSDTAAGKHHGGENNRLVAEGK